MFQLQTPDTAFVHLRDGQSQTALMPGWLLNAEKLIFQTVDFLAEEAIFNAVYQRAQ